MAFLAMGKCQRGADRKYQHITAEQYAQKRERRAANAASKAVAKGAAASAQVCVPFTSLENVDSCNLEGSDMVHSVLSGGDPAATSNVKVSKDVSYRRHARWNMRAVQTYDAVPEYEES